MTQSAPQTIQSENSVADATATMAIVDGPLGTSIHGGGLIRQSDAGWVIQVGSELSALPTDASPQLIAERFSELCTAVSGADNRCVLALASSECFFADFDPPDSIDPKDRRAVLYELERHFPLDAESMVADFSVDGSSRRISALAIETDRHRGLVDALENAGIEIVSILPASLLVARATLRWIDGNAPFRLFLLNRTAAESMLVDDDGVTQWRRFYDLDELRRHHTIIADSNDALQSVVVGRKNLSFATDEAAQRCNLSVQQLSAQGAAIVLGGRWGRWPDFRRGDLAPSDPLVAVARPLGMLALAATFCFLIITLAAWYRSARIADQSEIVREQQRSEFQSAFPGRRVPVMLLRTVRSEHSKTLGSRGGDKSIQLPIPATTVLGDLFRGLAHAQRVGGARYRLLDIDIADGNCSLTVRAEDAIQIGTIAKSLETVGLDVSPPASQQIDPSKEEPIPTYQSTIAAVWTASQANSQNGDGK